MLVVKMFAFRSVLSRVLLFTFLFGIGVGAPFLILGCDSADYLVIREAKSPDGQQSALLVRRRGHDSLSADVYFVILSRDAKGLTPNLPKAVHDKPVLAVTNGEDLRLQWSGKDALTISCNKCGMRSIDINEKRDRDGSVVVTYEGLP
jgi:hypothetical protein